MSILRVVDSLAARRRSLIMRSTAFVAQSEEVDENSYLRLKHFHLNYQIFYGHSFELCVANELPPCCRWARCDQPNPIRQGRRLQSSANGKGIRASLPETQDGLLYHVQASSGSWPIAWPKESNKSHRRTSRPWLSDTDWACLSSAARTSIEGGSAPWQQVVYQVLGTYVIRTVGTYQWTVRTVRTVRIP